MFVPSILDYSCFLLSFCLRSQLYRTSRHERKRNVSNWKSTEVPSRKLRIDPTHSSASFAIRHAVATFRGGFGQIEGRLKSADGEVSLVGSVEVESIDIDDENIRPHLLSPEFFDAERAPEVKFSSTAVETEGDEVVVRGDLAIAGATHEVEAHGHFTGPVWSPAAGEGRAGAEHRDRPDRLRVRLEHGAPGRRHRSRQRGRADRQPRARPVGS